MNLFINSPAYYTQHHGVIEEIDALLDQGLFREKQYVSLSCKMADISLRINYTVFYEADTDQKQRLILDNILRSLSVIKKKLKDEFEYIPFEKDIVEITQKTEVDL